MHQAGARGHRATIRGTCGDGNSAQMPVVLTCAAGSQQLESTMLSVIRNPIHRCGLPPWAPVRVAPVPDFMVTDTSFAMIVKSTRVLSVHPAGLLPRHPTMWKCISLILDRNSG